LDTARRDQLLRALETAEAEWGARKEEQLLREAEVRKARMARRGGARSVRRMVQDQLAEWTVDKVDEWLTG